MESPGRPPRLSHSSFALRKQHLLLSLCFTSTETIRLIRDGEPTRATSTFTQLLELCPCDRIHPSIYTCLLAILTDSNATLYIQLSLLPVFWSRLDDKPCAKCKTQMSCVPLLICTYCIHAPVPTGVQGAQRTLPAVILFTCIDLYFYYTHAPVPTVGLSGILLLICIYCTRAPVPTNWQGLRHTLLAIMYTSVDLYLLCSCTCTNWRQWITAYTSSSRVYSCTRTNCWSVRYTSVDLYLLYSCTRTSWRSGFAAYTPSCDVYLYWSVHLLHSCTRTTDG